MIEEVLRHMIDGPREGELCPNPEELRETAREMMRGDLSESQIAALLMGLRCRGERGEHVEAMVEAMMEVAVPFPAAEDGVPLYDTCGTGGDGHQTVNISSATAVLAATSGLRVAKHGNRAASSKSGSADVLKHLGLRLDPSSETGARMLRELGFCFLFAPYYHPAMRHAGPVRRSLKLRTIFNFCGPLANPAKASHQLIGVCDEAMLEPLARALIRLGKRRALVIRGGDGMDEISPVQVTHGYLVQEGGHMKSFRCEPSDFGVKPIEVASLVVSGVEESAGMIHDVLSGNEGPAADTVNMNLAVLLWLDGQTDNLHAAFNRAQEVQRSGEGLRLLEKACEMSHGV